MKRLSPLYTRLVMINIIIAINSIFCVSYAQQQQYANAYAFWDFGQNSNAVQTVDQKIWVALQAPSTQWVMTWSWTADPAHGGYLGFNTDENGKGQALFSLWNATQATGSNCQQFGGEGVGWSCRMPFEIRSDVFYNLRLARTKTEADGVWWGAWIDENPSSDAKEYFLGEIKVQSAMNIIRGNSINDFSEYYGQVQEKCSTVPFSILGVTPPAANKDESGNYSLNSKSNGASNPQENPCKTGDEPQGALFKAEDYDFGFAKGTLIFFGGTSNDHTLPDNIQVPSGN